MRQNYRKSYNIEMGNTNDASQLEGDKENKMSAQEQSRHVRFKDQIMALNGGDLSKNRHSKSALPDLEDSSDDEEGAKCTEQRKNNRILRIVRNIIGQQKMDIKNEQILTDIINEKKTAHEPKAKTHKETLYEQFLKREKEVDNRKKGYFQDMVKAKLYREEF